MHESEPRSIKEGKILNFTAVMDATAQIEKLSTPYRIRLLGSLHPFASPTNNRQCESCHSLSMDYGMLIMEAYEVYAK